MRVQETRGESAWERNETGETASGPHGGMAPREIAGDAADADA